MSKVIDVEESIVYKFYDRDDLSQCVQLLGENGFFSDNKDFHTYEYGMLSEVMCLAKGYAYPFARECYGKIDCFKYFITENSVVFKEEKKLRPYKDIEEFKRETKKYFSIGDTLLIRERKTGCVSELLYTGNYVVDMRYTAVDMRYTAVEHENIARICLGADMWTLEALSNYDFCINDTDWFPFGMKER